MKTPVFVHCPPNTLLRIDKLWAYVSKDEQGNEGLCAATSPGGMLLPLIAADPARLESIKAIAEQLAEITGRTLVLIELSTRTDVREIKGKAG